jgi:ribosomal protein L37AE/L43A
MRGKEFDIQHREKLSLKASNRSKVSCEHCNKEVVKQMYIRWHGKKCKAKI